MFLVLLSVFLLPDWQRRRQLSKNRQKMLKFSNIKGKRLGDRHLPFLFCVHSARFIYRIRRRKLAKCVPILRMLCPKGLICVLKKRACVPKTRWMFTKKHEVFYIKYRVLQNKAIFERSCSPQNRIINI